MTQNGAMSKKLRTAGLFIALGLVVQGISLVWNHPLAFMAFLGGGGLLLGIGIVIYLLALVSTTQTDLK